MRCPLAFDKFVRSELDGSNLARRVQRRLACCHLIMTISLPSRLVWLGAHMNVGMCEDEESIESMI